MEPIKETDTDTNKETGMEVTAETGTEPGITDKLRKLDKIKTVLFCTWVILAFLILQSGMTLALVAPKAVELFTASHGDQFLFRAKFKNYISSSSALLVFQALMEIVSAIVAFIWYWNGYVKKDRKAGTYKPLRQKFHGIKDICFIITGTIAAWSLAVVFQRIISMLMPKTAASVSSALNTTFGGFQLAGIIVAALMAPVFEELVVRGIILQHSKRSFGIIGCMIISAVLFGVFHMNMIQGVYVLPLGLFWGFVGYKYNSVIPCIICHMLNNLLGVLIPLKMVNPIILFVVFAVIAAFIGVKAGLFDKEASNDKEN